MMPEAKNVVIETKVFQRPSTTYHNNCEKYIIKNRTFDRQYATFYASRLKIAADLLNVQVRKKWGSRFDVKPLCDVTGSEKVVVLGTIFKHMELHPSILKEISEEYNLVPQPVTEEYTKDDDYLILEDDLQRVVLCGNIDPHFHVTGVNIAVLGYTEESGKFSVEDFCYVSVCDPGIRPTFSVDKYVLLISGIGLGNSKVEFPLQVLSDLITGQIGEENDQEKFSHLVRVIIAGNSISPQDIQRNKSKFLTRKCKSATVESICLLDEFISQIVTSVDVDIMPGEFDPANHLLPQQPLHPCMFPLSSTFSSFNLATNPYEATIDGVRFLGTSGQNVKDIKSYSKISEPLDVMQKMIDWGHISPTAPDSLNTYPFLNEDPFILSQYPHVYFSGNTSSVGFKFDDKKQVLMIAIPKFQETFSALMLNLRNFHVDPIRIGGTVQE